MGGTPVIRSGPTTFLTFINYDSANPPPINTAVGLSITYSVFFDPSSYIILSPSFNSAMNKTTGGGTGITACTISQAMYDDAIKGPSHVSVWFNAVFPVTTSTYPSSAAGTVALYADDGTNGVYINFYDSKDYNGGWKQMIADVTQTPSSSLNGGEGTAIPITGTIANIGAHINLSLGGESMFESCGCSIGWLGREIVVDGGTSTPGNEIDFGGIAAQDILSTMTTIAPFTGNYFGHVKNVGGAINLNGPIQIGNTDGVTVTYMLVKNKFILWNEAPVHAKFYRLDIAGAATTVIFGDSITPAPVTIDVGGTTLRWALDTATNLPTGFNTYGCTLKRGRAWKLGSNTVITEGVLQDITDIAMDASTQILNALLISVRLDYGLPPAVGKLTGCTMSSPVDYCMTVSTQQATMVIDYEFAASARGAGKAIHFTHASGNIELQFSGGVTPLVMADITVDGPGTVSIPAGSYTLTLTNLIIGTQVTIVNTVGRVELQNSTVDGTGIVTYVHDGTQTVDILLMHNNYDPNVSDVYDLALPSSDSSIKFQQLNDNNYNNPV